MTTTDYQPIACDLHSEYELLAMRRAWIRLDADLPERRVHGLSCQVVDVLTRDGAEYLELLDECGEAFSCRLDRVLGFTAQTGSQKSD